jgi:hypothetical protein
VLLDVTRWRVQVELPTQPGSQQLGAKRRTGLVEQLA